MHIQLAQTDNEILACHPVMAELRPHLAADEFVARVRGQQRDGYRLAFLCVDSEVVAVVGFRLGENLAWGRFLYVDDLVTAASQRSRGYGAAMLAWLRGQATDVGCAQLHLDSGSQRVDAHRFYEREGLPKTGFHFACKIP